MIIWFDNTSSSQMLLLQNMLIFSCFSLMEVRLLIGYEDYNQLHSSWETPQNAQ